MIGREGPGPERPGPDYPPEWDTEPEQGPLLDGGQDDDDTCATCGHRGAWHMEDSGPCIVGLTDPCPCRRFVLARVESDAP